MSDQAEYWRQTADARKSLRKQQKANRRDQAIDDLIEAGIEFDELNNGWHLRINDHLNYWPSTSKFFDDATGKHGQATTAEIIEMVRKK